MTAAPAVQSIGYIGLGNVGGKLAGSLVRNGYRVTVRDPNRDAAEPLLGQGRGRMELRVRGRTLTGIARLSREDA